MPLLRDEPFVKTPIPDDLEQDEEIFYCPLTEEIFRDYDEFFKRTILLNSLVWTCSVTGKTGLTYEEAVASERTTKHELEKLPPYAERAVAFLINFTLRGRIDDLVADLGNFLKERYFVGEVVECCHTGFKRTGTIVEIHYDWKTVKNKDKLDFNAFKYFVEMVRAPPKTQDSNSEMVTRESNMKSMALVPHEAVVRKKVPIPKAKCKAFIKINCEIDVDEQRYVVKPEIKAALNLGVLNWDKFFGGPEPQFPKTPLTRKPYVRSTSPHRDPMMPAEQALKTATPKANPESKPPKEKVLTPAEIAAEERRKQAVNAVIQDACKLKLPVSESVYSTDRAKSNKALSELKDEIKKAKDEEKLKQREERRKARELISDYKKPRDDLECDDHKPMPDFLPLNLPPGLSDDQFGDCLSIIDFLFAFSEQFQTLAAPPIDFASVWPSPSRYPEGSADCDEFAKCYLNDRYFERLGSNFYSEFLLGRGDAYLELICIFLRMIFLKTLEDDGEETTPVNVDSNSTANSNKEECQQKDQQHSAMDKDSKENFDESQLNSSATDSTNLFSRQYLDEAKAVYEFVKNTFGVPVRNLPLTERTLTEVTRLYFLTSGHSPNGQTASRHRFAYRGNYKCWDDYAFSFRVRRQDIVDLLATKSLIDLSAADRLQILLALRDQLLTFTAFRNPLQQKMERLNALRAELRQWQTFEQRWEKESQTAKAFITTTNADEKTGDKEKIDNQDVADKEKAEETDKSSESELYEKIRRYFDAGESKVDKLKFVLQQQTDIFAKMRKAEIDDVRRMQKQFLVDEENRASRQIVDLRASCGLTLLGRDRAYRKYWLLPCYNVLLVELGGDENFISEANLHTCEDEPTPTDRVEDKTVIPERLLICVGAKNRSRDRPCPVHDSVQAATNGRSWYCVNDHATFAQLLEALNKRGFRESELYENLRFYQEFLTKTCLPFSDVDFFALEDPAAAESSACRNPQRAESSAKNLQHAESSARNPQHAEYSITAKNPQHNNESAAMAAEMCSRLSHLERNLLNACLGFVKVNHREIWRRNLYTSSKAADTIALQAMIKALIQISDGIDQKYIKGPLCTKNMKDCSTFQSWKQSIASSSSSEDVVRSWSQLFLYLETFERSINWRRAAAPPIGERQRQHHVTSSAVAVHKKYKKPSKQSIGGAAGPSSDIMGSLTAKTKSTAQRLSNGYHDSLPNKSSTDRPQKSRDHANKTDDSEQQHVHNDVKMSRTGRVVKRPVSFEELSFDKKLTNHNSTFVNSSWHTNDQSDETSEYVGVSGVSGASKKQRRPSADVSDKCKQLLRLATHSADAWPFLKPVSKKDAPDYYAVIKTPMDLQTMRERLNAGYYASFDQFLADLRRIFENCRSYNDPQALVYQCGQRLEKYLNSKLKEFE